MGALGSALGSAVSRVVVLIERSAVDLKSGNLDTHQTFVTAVLAAANINLFSVLCSEPYKRTDRVGYCYGLVVVESRARGGGSRSCRASSLCSDFGSDAGFLDEKWHLRQSRRPQSGYIGETTGYGKLLIV